MTEIFIYGYGSDGMVGASKDIIKIVGNQKDSYVQGYFQYDSKKSGGITRSHIRIADEPIRSTYYISNPDVVVCTKESYLNKFNMLNGINENGIFILNTMFDENEIIEHLPDSIKKTLALKNVKFYIVNAYELARKVGLDGKISTIMETIIFKITNIVDFNTAKAEILDDLNKRFGKKGEEIIKANGDAINDAEKYVKEIKVDKAWQKLEVKETIDSTDFFDMMNFLEGDKLPTSAFLDKVDGTFVGGTTKMKEEPLVNMFHHLLKIIVLNVINVRLFVLMPSLDHSF